MMQDAKDKHSPEAYHGCITDIAGLPAWQLGQLGRWEGAAQDHPAPAKRERCVADYH